MEEEKYRLTVRGLFEGITPDKKDALDLIELYLRRNDYNAIILTDDGFIFAKVELEEEDENDTGNQRADV